MRDATQPVRRAVCRDTRVPDCLRRPPARFVMQFWQAERERCMMENRNERPAAASGAFAICGDLHASRLGFGAMRITGDGVWGPPKEKDAAIAVLKRTQDPGITLIGTADVYGPEVSESLIAEVLYLCTRA